MREQWILITGTSSGIGRATAMKLARRGYNILAGARKQSDFDELQREFLSGKNEMGGHLESVILDVTDSASISAAGDAVAARVGTIGLYALINNAGIAVPGPVEFVSAADWRRQFEVNFFGPIELTKRCLPLLRQAVKTFGRFTPRLIFISSVGGRVAQPMAAPYTTSKFATSSLGDSLRLELYPQGIGVTIIEPGTIDTPIWDKGQSEIQQIFGPDHPAREHYGKGIDGLSDLVQKSAKWGISPDQVAGVVAATLTHRRAPGRVLVGLDARAVTTLRTLLPLSWFDAMLRRAFGLHDPIQKT